MPSTANATPRGPPEPYVGMRPYEARERDLLTGRGEDARILTDKVFSARVTLFYALSGLGKSSVLRALVIPNLESQECETIYLDAWSGAEPETELRIALCNLLTLHGLGGAFGDSDSLAELVRSVAADGRTVALVLDQFEEFLLNHPQRLDPLRTELAALVNDLDLDLRLVITMREEFLANLEPFREKIVNLFQSTYRLEPLDRDAVRRAIAEPVKRFGVGYEQALLNRLVDDLEARKEPFFERPRPLPAGLEPRQAVSASQRVTSTIDLPMLQIVCKELWETAKPKDGETLTLDLYGKMGGAKSIMHSYVVKAMPRVWGDRLDTANLMRFLAPPSGLKLSYTVSDLAAMSRLDAKAIERELRRLASKDVRILRIREFQGAERFELQHDALVPHIASWRDDVLARGERRRRIGKLASGGIIAIAALVFAAAAYIEWRGAQPWGSVTNLFDGHVDELKGDFITVGRSAGAITNKIDVPDAQSKNVSRLHLLVSRDLQGDPLVVDFRSLNGTTVNGEFLQYGDVRKLEEGDIVSLAGAAAFRFRRLTPPLFPFLPREELKFSALPEAAWALVIDGRSKDSIPLTGEEYFLSADRQECISLGPEKWPGSLLRIVKAPEADSQLKLFNLAHELFLTVMVKCATCGDHWYYSFKMPVPVPKKGSEEISEVLRVLPGGGGEYISKVTLCFSRAEQQRNAELIDPGVKLSCDIGPLQIVVARDSGESKSQPR